MGCCRQKADLDGLTESIIWLGKRNARLEDRVQQLEAELLEATGMVPPYPDDVVDSPQEFW